MKTNVFHYLIDTFKVKYGERWLAAIKPYIEKENVNVKWVNGHQVLVVDRIKKYKNRLARVNKEI